MVLSGRDEEEDGEGRGRRECSGRGKGDKDNRGKGDDAGIRLANAFISIRRGRVTCSPLRSISSTSFARSPPSNLLPLPFRLPSSLPPRPPHRSSFSPSLFRFCSILSSLSLSLVTSAFTLSLPLFVPSLVLPRFLSVCASLVSVSLFLFFSFFSPLYLFLCLRILFFFCADLSSLCDFVFSPLISFCFRNYVCAARIFPRLCSRRASMYRYGRVSFKRKSAETTTQSTMPSVTTSRRRENERFSISQAEDERSIHIYMCVYTYVCVISLSRGSAIA